MELKGFVHIRIDTRLIHGQVAGFWTGYLQASRIMVIDDEVAVDDMQKELLRMVAPAGVATSLLAKEKALENIKTGKYANQRVLLLVKTPYYLKYLMDNGIDIKAINVGNMATRDNTRVITSSISITQEEEEIFKELLSRGVDITVQMAPEDKAKKIKDLL
ncbi:PTS sugar transporter subunit IIB [Faecalicatena orotica]|uniref:PTS system mannose-specific IIB component n=1 Tax=Faecalicatena orotica TaxID=1544 RepID=A0A2Y9BC35_9FIRM|nr:PTS sugar transporter subunit IIB [Faecalicatena orotica]PWJ32464.1 PTS system mannose-specific IIB component [Faecalicatena orotica]SSA54299.1 PTS system, mannose-specific IIB component [Faecalicatena orotica]